MSAPEYWAAREAIEKVPAELREGVIEWVLQLADIERDDGWRELGAYLRGWLDAAGRDGNPPPTAAGAGVARPDWPPDGAVLASVGPPWLWVHQREQIDTPAPPGWYVCHEDYTTADVTGSRRVAYGSTVGEALELGLRNAAEFPAPKDVPADLTWPDSTPLDPNGNPRPIVAHLPPGLPRAPEGARQNCWSCGHASPDARGCGYPHRFTIEPGEMSRIQWVRRTHVRTSDPCPEDADGCPTWVAKAGT